MLALAAAAISTVSSFTTLPRLPMARPSVCTPRMSVAGLPSMLVADGAAALPTLLLADNGVVAYWVFLAALPLVAGGAFVLVDRMERQKAEQRADPANASRLGYTQEEVDRMDELTRLRYEDDLREFYEAVAEADAMGMPRPEPMEWLAQKNARNGGYFDGGNNERA